MVTKVAFYCMDERLSEGAVDEVLQNVFGEGKYYGIRIAGGAGNFARSWDEARRKVALDDMMLAITKKEAEEVVVFGHVDCGKHRDADSRYPETHEEDIAMHTDCVRTCMEELKDLLPEEICIRGGVFQFDQGAIIAHEVSPVREEIGKAKQVQVA